MKIFTTEEIREIDKYTIEVDGVSALDLIERVGEGVVAEVTARWLPSKPVVIFAGPGNNGADALSAGRILYEKGFRPKIFLFNIGGDRLSKDCRVCRDRVASLPGIDFVEVTSTFSLPDLLNTHLVIDGLFGSGLRDQLTGGFTSLVQYINESRATVISIDVPSGMFGDWNKDSIHRNVIHADLTLVIQFPRPAFFLRENAELVGDWKILDIGLSQKAMATIVPTYYMIESHDVKRKLKRRHPFASKNDLGTAAIIAGSYGMMGAAVFANKAAIRGGIGKVTAIAPRCGFNILQTAVPEAMFQADKNEIVISNIALKQEYSAVALGPGLGTHEMTISAVDDFLASRNRPVIIDADGLNCIAKRPTILNNLPVMSIITPHAGEFDRLFGQHSTDYERLKKAIEVSRQYNIFIILKGHYTAIIRPDGKIYFNSSGTPAMATAGAGDCLTGLIASFLAQGYLPEIAAILGVFIHGRAGEIAEERQGLYSVTASDICDCIGPAINSIIDSE